MDVRNHLRQLLAGTEARTLDIPAFTPSAVLVPLIERRGEVSVAFIRRPDGMPTHAGQIGFPGGRCQPQDADAGATALREAKEELGIAAAGVQVLGEMDDVATPSGFVITPICAWMTDPPPFQPDPREVNEHFEVTLSELAAPSRFSVRGERHVAGRTYELFEYQVQGRIIWGATARMVHQLLEHLTSA